MSGALIRFEGRDVCGEWLVAELQRRAKKSVAPPAPPPPTGPDLLSEFSAGCQRVIEHLGAIGEHLMQKRDALVAEIEREGVTTH